MVLGVGAVGIAEGGHAASDGILDGVLAPDDLASSPMSGKLREARVGKGVGANLVSLGQLAHGAGTEALGQRYLPAPGRQVERARHPVGGQLRGQPQVELVPVIPTCRDVDRPRVHRPPSP